MRMLISWEDFYQKRFVTCNCSVQRYYELMLVVLTTIPHSTGPLCTRMFGISIVVIYFTFLAPARDPYII